MYEASPAAKIGDFASYSNIQAYNAIFIDRNGPMFAYILDYIRRDKLLLPDDFTEWESLKNEIEYYQVQGMKEMFDRSYQAYAVKNKKKLDDLQQMLYRATFHTASGDGVTY